MRQYFRVLVLLLSGGVGVIAHAKAPLSAQGMWNLSRLGPPAISPDGRLAAVPVTRYDVGENKAFTDLWLITVASGHAQQLTSNPAPASDPVFSPDGREIAFVSKRNDDRQSQIYVIAVDGGEARRVTNVPTGAGTPKWFADGRRIAFVSSIWTDLVRWEDQAKRMAERDESKMSAKVWSRAPVAYWDHLLDDREAHIFSIEVGGGEPVAVTRLSGFHLPASGIGDFSYDISPDGTEIAFAADVDKSGVDTNFDIIVLPSCGCKPARDITLDSPADDASPRYSPDGKLIAFSQQRVKHFNGDRARLMIFERATGRTLARTENWDRSVTEAIWLPGSKALLASVDDAATDRLYRIDLRPGVPHAMTGASSFTAPAAGTTGTVAIRESFSEPPTLVRIDLSSGKATALSTFNDAALAQTAFGKVESISYAGARNDRVQMWMIYPPDFDPAKKYPVYMLLHGGPHHAVTDVMQWRWNAQVFAGWGYIVTWHNFHGSSGFGQAFTDSINPDQISLPYEDTIKATQWLMEQPYVDHERLAAGGGSFGGFLADVLLGREHPFKTLITHAGVYDQYTQIAADYGAEKPRFYAYWERPEEFARNSPNTYAAHFNTPTLVIHNQLDMRVPVDQGIELFNTLQMRGVPSKLVYFPDENHFVLKPQNSLFWYRVVQEWLAQYVPPGGRANP